MVNEERARDGRVRVLQPEGRLDVAVATAFGDQVRHLLDVGSTKLVIDLGGVSVVDSSGLGMILVGLRLARHAGGDVRIARPPQQFKLLLQTTSLNQILPPYPSVEEALADFD